MKESQIEAVKVWADYMVNVAIKNANEDNASREKEGRPVREITDKLIQSCRESWEKDGVALAELLLTKDGLYKKFCVGAFHPSNKATRKLLESLYGIELPSQAGKTREAVKALIGEDYIAEQVHRATEAKERAEAEEREKQEAEYNAYILPLLDKVSKDESIGGSELVDVAKHLDISVHIRTQGTLNQRVSWVNGQQCSHYPSKSGKNTPVPSSVFKLYRECHEKIKTGDFANV